MIDIPLETKPEDLQIDDLTTEQQVEVYINIDIKDSERIIDMMLVDATEADVIVDALLDDPGKAVDLLEAILTSASDESADTEAAQTAILSTIEDSQGQVAEFDETRIPEGDVKQVTEDMSFVEQEAVLVLNSIVSQTGDEAAELRWSRDQAGYDDTPPPVAPPEGNADGKVIFNFGVMLDIIGSESQVERLNRRSRQLGRDLQEFNTG